METHSGFTPGRALLLAPKGLARAHPTVRCFHPCLLSGGDSPSTGDTKIRKKKAGNGGVPARGAPSAWRPHLANPHVAQSTSLCDRNVSSAPTLVSQHPPAPQAAQLPKTRQSTNRALGIQSGPKDGRLFSLSVSADQHLPALSGRHTPRRTLGSRRAPWWGRWCSP